MWRCAPSFPCWRRSCPLMTPVLLPVRCKGREPTNTTLLAENERIHCHVQVDQSLGKTRTLLFRANNVTIVCLSAATALFGPECAQLLRWPLSPLLEETLSSFMKRIRHQKLRTGMRPGDTRRFLSEHSTACPVKLCQTWRPALVFCTCRCAWPPIGPVSQRVKQPSARFKPPGTQRFGFSAAVDYNYLLVQLVTYPPFHLFPAQGVEQCELWTQPM